MARRSRTQITKQLAEKIVDKLNAIEITEKGDEHDEYAVYHEEILIAEFGIRRGSNKNSGHDHIPGDLGVGPGFAKQLAYCPKSRNDYLLAVGAVQPPTEPSE